MKYGETLRQRSIPAWSHHNIDYDEIKWYIKEQTTPSNSKKVSIAGRDDDQFAQFERSLFQTLTEQHTRITLFVKSKAGEIQRRIDHSKRLLRQLSARATINTQERIPVSRLERYGRLENDVLKAGDEIKSLARFSSAQRDGFRKLLKKYRKWTGSTRLEDRLREEVLNDPKSFTKLDLGPLLDDYSTTLQEIRDLFVKAVQSEVHKQPSWEHSAATGSSVIARLQATIEEPSRVDFDTAIATVPLGEHGTFASYFVHPENVVELQVLLLQHARFFSARSRSSSISAPVSSPTHRNSFGSLAQYNDDTAADYFALEADDAPRLIREHNAVTVIDREQRPGSSPQKAQVCVRWNDAGDAEVAYKPSQGKVQYATLKRKFVSSLVDRSASFPLQKAALSPQSEQTLAFIRRAIERDERIRPLYNYSSCRSRLVGINNSNEGLVLATLDTHISYQRATDAGGIVGDKHDFPFAVLLVRQEGTVKDGLIASLEDSHLVERVRGFSLEYHAIWQTSQPHDFPPPFWLSMLNTDIRKLPPPAVKQRPGSVSRTPSSADSPAVWTDSATAVETAQSDSMTRPSALDAPPLRSFRKKRRRPYPERTEQLQTKYWNEYDHPEDDDDSNAYVIYIDPNAKSAFDTLIDRLGGLFSRRRKPEDEEEEEEALLSHPPPPSPKDDDESSSEEDNATAPAPRSRSYGTLKSTRSTSGQKTAGPVAAASYDLEAQPTPSEFSPFPPTFTAIAFVASLVILAVAVVLAATGKSKLRYEVHFGVLFAVSSSLLFAMAGFAALIRRAEVSYPAWGIGVLVLVVDAVGAGGLLAWMFG